MPSNRKIRQMDDKLAYGGFIVTVEYADGEVAITKALQTGPLSHA